MADDLTGPPLTCIETARELGYSLDWFYRIRGELEALGLTPIPGRDKKHAQKKYAREVVARYKAGMTTAIAGFVPQAAMSNDLNARLAARAKMVAAKA